MGGFIHMEKEIVNEHFVRLKKLIPVNYLDKIEVILASSYKVEDGIQTYNPLIIQDFLNEIIESDEKQIIVKKLLLAGFILKNWSTLTLLKNKAYEQFFQRACHFFSDDYTLRNIDVFWKELAIARLQFFPIHSGVAEFYSGFGISQGLSLNPIQMFQFLKILLFKGRRPYYQIHTHTPVLNNFNPEGWQESYKEIAKMLKLNSNIKGVVRGSWFFDPKVKEISPHLGYLRDFPLQNGAETFRIGPDTSGNALATSKSRLKKFEEGKYTPMNYLLVWPREAIISWYEESERNSSKIS
jgi:hypothetical protein